MSADKKVLETVKAALKDRKFGDLGKVTLENARKAFDKTWELPGQKIVDRVVSTDGVTIVIDRTIIPDPIPCLEIKFTIPVVP